MPKSDLPEHHTATPHFVAIPRLESIHDVEQALLPLATITRWATGKNITADRTRDLLQYLGSPHQGIRIVHVAGTSGKTSTTSYIAALLRAAGNKVGHTTSPHIDSLTERVQINGSPLADQQFCDYTKRFIALIQTYAPAPSWQEYFTAFALWVFRQEHVDYIVLETAVGGLYDATNAVTSADKVCVITDIGYDHMELLGTTLESITANKAGIIHPGNTVLLYDQGPLITKIVQNYAANHAARTMVVPAPAQHGTLPYFQQRNWELAYATYRYIAHRDRLPDVPPPVLRATQDIIIPGRMETMTMHGKTVIMDGAHNPQKMAALMRSMNDAYPGLKLPVVLALKDSKDIAGTVEPLLSVASTLYLTTFPPVAGIATTAANPTLVADALHKLGMHHYQIIPDPQECFNTVLKSPEPFVLVTGSFYLLAALRRTHSAD